MVIIALFVAGCSDGFFGGEPYNVSGIVVDGSDNGVEGVTISVTQVRKPSTTLTGKDGKWRVTGLQEDAVLRPSKLGYVFEPSSYKVDEAEKDIVFEAAPKEGTYIASGIIKVYGSNRDEFTLRFEGDELTNVPPLRVAVNQQWSQANLRGDVKIVMLFDGCNVTPSARYYDVRPADSSEYKSNINFTVNCNG